MKRLLILLILLIVAACTRGTHREARERYNEGVAALEAQDWAKAQEAFLAARSEAGVDPELRWRAAFDLGVAYAGQANVLASNENDPAKLEQAHELYGAAAGWFQDAIRLDDDPAARANLEIVLARQQAVADKLSGDQKRLEVKLDALIEGERTIRDRARGLLEQARAGAATNPAALEGDARGLATEQRVLLADAGVVVDLAGAESATIEGKAEEERTPEEQMRFAQLGVLQQWVQIARTALGDTRRMLDEGKLELAHERAEEAVDALKRAREVLLDPVEVLRAIAQDEIEVAQRTGYLQTAAAEAKKIGGQPAPVPAWLTPAHLAGRQHEVSSRLDEIRAMFDAAVSTPTEDPTQAGALARVNAARPDLDAASQAMTRSSDGLTTNDLAAASAAQLEAVIALGRAMEQFMALRGLLELTWQQQQEMVRLMMGEGDAEPQERAKQAAEGLERNLGRLGRMQQLLVDEKATMTAPPEDPNAPPPTPEQVQQIEQMFAQAELLRGQALAALQELAGGKSKRPPLEPAQEALDRVSELRKLFFSIIEHLQELIREQGETRDASAEVAGLDDVGRAPLLPGVIERQTEHRAMAQMIADALAAQADQAAQQPAAPQPGAPDPAKLGAAAEEVRAAGLDMDDASALLTKANDPNLTASVDLQPALDSEQSAIDHLKAALALLQPPQDQQPQEDQQQQQDQQQDQQQQQQDQSVDRRREQVREQEAQRRREREQQQRNADDPVEKDW